MFNPKTKTVTVKAPSKSSKPMFVQCILETIWKIYKDLLAEFPKSSKSEEDTTKSTALSKIQSKLHLTIVEREFMGRDWRGKMQVVFNNWLSIPKAVLGMVVEQLPDPITAQQYRLQRFWNGTTETSALASDALHCTRDSPHILINVTKMMDMTDPKAKNDKTDEEPPFVAFARIFSGTIRTSVDQTLYIYGPKYDPTDPSTYSHVTRISSTQIQLYLLMGRDLTLVDAIPAGNVFAIGGLSYHILRTATISTCHLCIPFHPMIYQSAPIVRVAVEPVNAMELKQLGKGLARLNQADPNVQVHVQETGEHVIVASGELHLERCLTDLRERFARGIEFRVSEPLVAFRETVVEGDNVASDVMNIKMNAKKEEKEKQREEDNKKVQTSYDNDDGDISDTTSSIDTSELPTLTKFHIQMHTPNQRCILVVRAVPLPPAVTTLLDQSSKIIAACVAKAEINKKKLRLRRPSQTDATPTSTSAIDATSTSHTPTPSAAEALTEITSESVTSSPETIVPSSRPLTPTLNDDDTTDAPHAASTTSSLPTDSDITSFITSLREAFTSAGDIWSGDDVDHIWSLGPRRIGPNILINRVTDLTHHTSLVQHTLGTTPTYTPTERDYLFTSIENSIVQGFQVTCSSGPLCEEPLMGCCFILDAIILREWDSNKGNDPYGALSGQMLSTMNKACRAAFLARSVRLMEAMYSVDLSVSADQLGNLYGVITKRRGRITSEEMTEGSVNFVVKALLPVAESFGFAGDLRKKTVGSAQPQLVFSHWELLPIDPFFIPRTADELEEFGDQDRSPNLARTIIDTIRKRKGLAVQQKVVESATKQRTLARKK